MDIIEYQERHLALLNKHEEEIKKLNNEYAFSHNTVAVGDIVEDHLGRVRVSLIGVAVPKLGTKKLPQCVYGGDVLLKSGAKSKRNLTRWVYQTNLLTEQVL